MEKLPLLPPYNISVSAQRLAQQCERRAALAGPGAWQGWPRGTRAKDPLAALCYESKHLQELPQSLGIAIHTVAQSIVREVARSGRRQPYDVLLHEVMQQMRDLWLRQRRAFESDPKLGMLLCKYFGRTESPAAIERVKVGAPAAIRRLLRAALLDDLAQLQRGDRVQTEQLLQMPVTADGLPPATLFGKADLVYTHRQSLAVDGAIIAPGAAGIPVIADFKTGRVNPAEVTLQLSLSAVLLRANGLEPHPIAGYVGRIIDLSPHGPDEDSLIVIGGREFAAADAWVRRAHTRVAAVPRGADGQVTLADIPASRGAHCHSCPMQRACEAVSGDVRRVEDAA